LMIMLKGKSIV